MGADRGLLAGGSSLALQLLIQGMLVDWLTLPARWGIVLAYELALVAHFFVNDRWVFEAEGRAGVWRRLVAFHAAALGAEAVTLAVAFVALAAPLASFAANRSSRTPATASPR